MRPHTLVDNEEDEGAKQLRLAEEAELRRLQRKQSSKGGGLELPESP